MGTQALHPLNLQAPEIEAEIDAGGIEFDAEYFHQLFGDDEVIKGYKDLCVNVWMSVQTYHTWLEIRYSKKKMGADKIEKVSQIVSDCLHVVWSARARITSSGW